MSFDRLNRWSNYTLPFDFDADTALATYLRRARRLPNQYVTPAYLAALKAEPELTYSEEFVLMSAGFDDAHEPWVVLKNIIYPLIGYGRGYSPRMAPRTLDTKPGSSWSSSVSPGDVWASLNRRAVAVPEGNTVEEWLRSSAAFDAVTDPWLKFMEDHEAHDGRRTPGRHRPACPHCDYTDHEGN